jgi:hypothetical protein
VQAELGGQISLDWQASLDRQTSPDRQAELGGSNCTQID